jgi:hypothetical protein
VTFFKDFRGKLSVCDTGADGSGSSPNLLALRSKFLRKMLTGAEKIVFSLSSVSKVALQKATVTLQV